jgi:hypothetical protein
VKRWCNRHAGWLAVGFGVLSVALATLVVAQAITLHAQGWRMAMGTFPEWMSGFGTLFTAIAAYAAFLALRIATNDWEGSERERGSLDKERQALAKARDAERRDHDISQARLIIVDYSVGQLVVVNHSNAPIFNLAVQGVSPKDPAAGLYSADGHLAPREKVVLPPGQKSEPINIHFGPGARQESLRDHTQHVDFTFTDARGARWRRIGSQQPVQLLEES